MSLRKAVYNLLNDYESDVYPLAAPQELTVPYLTYEMSVDFTKSQQGTETQDVYLTLRIYANDFSDCISLADTMSAALDRKAGTYSDETLHICNWLSESDGYAPELDKYMITQEYQLRFI